MRSHPLGWAAALLVGLAASAAAGEIGGKWRAEFDTMVGVQKYTFEFKLEGDKLTGKASADRAGEKEEVVLSECKLTADEVSFVENMTWQGQTVPVRYKGKLQGDELKLTRDVGGFASEELVARRVKD